MNDFHIIAELLSEIYSRNYTGKALFSSITIELVLEQSCNIITNAFSEYADIHYVN